MTAPRPRLYGVVYELVLTDTPPDVCEYVGKARNMKTRMAATGSGHRSARSIAKDPWKARIRPGAAGYRILERVWSTGDDRLDEAALRRAESDWIDRRSAKRNDVRPVRPRVHEAPPRPVKTVPRRTVAQQRAATRARRRGFGFLLLFAAYAGLLARALSATPWPWPPTPWVVSFGAGAFFAWATLWWCVRTARRLSRGFR